VLEVTLSGEFDGPFSLVFFEVQRFPGAIIVEGTSVPGAALHVSQLAAVVRAEEIPLISVGIPTLREPLSLSVLGVHGNEDSEALVDVTSTSVLGLHIDNELGRASSVSFHSIGAFLRIASAFGTPARLFVDALPVPLGF